MSEDTFITIAAIVLMAGALYIGAKFRNSKGMKVFKIIMWPFTMLKNILDPNYWASKIGNKTGAYDKAYNSKTAKWSRSLTGRRWWAWQIGSGLVFVIIIEFLLNLIGMSMLPWRW
jgi:hypothetical protein